MASRILVKLSLCLGLLWVVWAAPASSDYLCAYNFNGGMGFQCEDNGFWSQNPPLPYCYGGTIPESFLCD